MTLYDSSLLINYLNGDADTVAYIEGQIDERTIAPPLVMFEVYQGEVFKSGPTDLAAVDDALQWVTVVEVGANVGRAAAELQDDLQTRGEPLSARDAYVAGAAKAFDERLAVADSDFEVEGITDVLEVDVL